MLDKNTKGKTLSLESLGIDWRDRVGDLAKALLPSAADTASLRQGLNQVFQLGATADDLRALAARYHAAGGTATLAAVGIARFLADLATVLFLHHRWRPGQAADGLRLLTQAIDPLLVAFTAGHAGPSDGEAKIAGSMMDHTVDAAASLNDAAIANAEMVGQLRAVDSQAHAIAAATEETVAGVHEISDRSRDVARLAAEAHEVAQVGRHAVGEAVQGMEAIAGAVADSARRVEELSEASDRIQDILASIEAIASQTNLLALNATIEAARAGEAGKGFAVVASEVKNLAAQTGRATEDIRLRLAELREEMQAIVASMAAGTRAVEQGQQRMHEVTARIDDVTARVDTTTERMAEIASILTQQTAAAQEVAHGVATIAGKAKENSASIMRNVEATQAVETLLGRQLAEMMQLDIPNKILKIAKVDHFMWKKRLADMVVGLEHLRPDQLARHETCRLGQWYYGAGSLPFRDLASFQALEAPHKAVHEHGIRAAELFNKGDLPGAMREIAAVEKASREVVHHLDRLQQAPATRTREVAF